MEPDTFLDKKEIELEGVKFMISKIPAIQSQKVYGEIMKEAKSDGDIAMTYLSPDTAKDLLAYTAYFDGANWLSLDQDYRINDSCKNLEVLMKLQAAMIQYNYGFLFDGGLQKVLAALRGEADISQQE